jgi:hypothetical protein
VRGIETVVQQCIENINFNTAHKLPVEGAGVLITTPKGWKAPPRFPRGEILNVKPDGTRVRRMPAWKLLAWLIANGFAPNVEMKTIK